MSVSLSIVLLCRTDVYLNAVNNHRLQLSFQAQQYVFHFYQGLPSDDSCFLGVFVGTIFAGAFAFGIGFDIGVTKFYDYWNRGVRCSFVFCIQYHLFSQKQWKDIRQKYVQEGSE